MYNQQEMHVTAEVKNPASCVTAGIARIPAPTVVPATRKMALVRLPGSCSMVAWLRLEKRRSSCGGESGGCRSSAYWEQRHLRSGLLVPLLITRLGTGVLAEIEEGRSRGQQ